MGLMRIVDMGTGVNGEIIGTSTLWRFDFITGIILLAMTWPISYILTKYYYGITGPAIASLVSVTVYNGIRYWYLVKKFGLQPFNIKTLYTLLLGVALYFICWFLFKDIHGFWGLVFRSTTFLLLYVTVILSLKISPDLLPIWQTFKKKIGIN